MATGQATATSWPQEVERILLPVFAKAGQWASMTEEDADNLATYFIYPNLIHWVLKMARRARGRACADACPVCSMEAACSDAWVEAPEAVIHRDGHDLCPRCFARHPWSLQVALLWTAGRPRGEGGDEEHGRPARECAWDVFAKVVDHPAVRRRWSAIQPGRPETVQEQWDRLAEAMEQAFQADWRKAGPFLADAVVKSIDRQLLVGLCARSANVLAMWTRRQAKLPNPHRERLERVVMALVNPVLDRYRRGWPFPTASCANEADEFCGLLDDLRVPGRQHIRSMLAEPQLGTRSQLVLLGFIRDSVMPFRVEGLPPGDPLDDRLVQDLFWHRVGREDSASGSPGFNLRRWCDERWRPAGRPGRQVPRWRTVP